MDTPSTVSNSSNLVQSRVGVGSGRLTTDDGRVVKRSDLLLEVREVLRIVFLEIEDELAGRSMARLTGINAKLCASLEALAADSQFTNLMK